MTIDTKNGSPMTDTAHAGEPGGTLPVARPCAAYAKPTLRRLGLLRRLTRCTF